MPASHDDELLWDDEAPKPKKRPPHAEPPRAERPPEDGRRPQGFRRKHTDRYDVVADLDEDGRKKTLLWIVGGIGAGVIALAVVLILVLSGGGKEPEVAADAPPPAPGDPVRPVEPVGPAIDMDVVKRPVPEVKSPAAFADPVEIGRRTELKRAREVDIGPGVVKLGCAPAHHFLITLSPTELTVYDVAAGARIASSPARGRFTDLSVAPDGETAFAIDAPQPGGGAAAVHRFRADTRAVEKLPVEWNAVSVTALDDRRIVVGYGAANGKKTFLWPSEAGKGLGYLSWNQFQTGDALFDPHRRTLRYRQAWYANGNEYRVGMLAQPLGSPEVRVSVDRPAADLDGSFTATPDGGLIFLGKVAVRATDNRPLPFTFPEPIAGATRDVAIGLSGKCYHATSGVPLAALDLPATAVHVTGDGRAVWVHDAARQKAVEFEVRPTPPGTALPAAGYARTGQLEPPTDPAPAGTLVAVSEVAAKPFDEPVRAVAVANRYGLVFLLTEKKLWVYAVADDKFFVAVTSETKLGGMSLAPDESVAFVTDFAGGVGGRLPAPVGDHKVYRYWCADRRAESQGAPYTASRVTAIAPDTVLLTGPNEYPESTVAVWAEGQPRMRVVGPDHPVSRGTAPNTPVFHPFASRMLRVETSGGALTVYELGSEGLRVTQGLWPNEHLLGGRVSVSNDGSRVYVGAQQLIWGTPMPRAVKMFPRTIIAAARDVAVSSDGTLFAAATATECGHLGYTPAAVAVSRDGRTLWGYDEEKKRLVRHAVGTPVAGAPPKVEPRKAPPTGYTPPADPFPAGAALEATTAKTVSLGANEHLRMVAYSAAHEVLFAQGGPTLHILDGKTGDARKVAGGPPFSGGPTLATDGAALFTSAGSTFRYDAAKGEWASRFPPDRGMALAGGGTATHTAAMDGGRIAVVYAKDGIGAARLALLRWGERLELVAEAELSGRNTETGHLAYDPASGILLVLQRDGSKQLARRVWFDNAKPGYGEPIGMDFGKTQNAKLVVSATGRRCYLGQYRLSPADGTAELMDYGGAVVAAVHDLVLTEKGELRDAVTGKPRGSLGQKVAAAAFAPDGKSLWVADGGTLVRYTLKVNAGAVAAPPPLNGFADLKPVTLRRPAPPEPSGSLTKFTADGTIDKPAHTVDAVRVSQKHGLVILDGSSGGLKVFDTATGKLIPGPKTEARFISPSSLTPDEEALFATDQRESVYRLSLKDRKWESAAGKARDLVALDARTLLTVDPVNLQDKTTVRLVAWTGAEMKELAAATVPGHLSKFAYDAANAHLLAAGKNPHPRSDWRLRAYPIGGKPFAAAWDVAAEGPHVRWGSDILSWDGSRYHNRGEAFRTDTGKVEVKFDEEIKVATRDVAVGASGTLYAAATGKVVGTLKHRVQAGGVSRDGRTVWVHDPGKEVLRKYLVSAETPVAPVPVAPPVKPVPVAPPVKPPLVADDWTPPKFERPKIETPVGKQIGLKLEERVSTPKPLTPQFLVHADAHDRLFVVTQNDGLVALSGTKFTAAAGGRKFAARLSAATRPSLAPDQSALFLIADKALWRYDLAADTWDSRPTDAGTVFAVAGDRVLLVRPDGLGAALELAKWTPDALAVTARAAIKAPPLTPLGYDPVSGTALGYQRVVGSGKDHLVRVTIRAGTLTVTTTPVDAPTVPVSGGVLAWDFGRLYSGARMIDTATGRATDVAPNSGPVLAAARDIAITSNGTVLSGAAQLADAQHIGGVTTAAVSPNGRLLFLCNGLTFSRYALTDAVAPPPPKKEPPKVVPPKTDPVNPPKKNPPLVVPFPGAKQEPPTAAKLPLLDPIPPGEWKPATRARPVLPEAVGTLTKLVRSATLTSDGEVKYLYGHSQRHGFLAQGVVGDQLLDLKEHRALPLPDAVKRFDTLDFSADGEAVFCTAAKGVYRYHLPTRTWEFAELKVGRVIALDADTVVGVVAHVTDGETLSVYTWGKKGVAAVGTLPGRTGRTDKVTFDPTTGAVYSGGTEVSKPGYQVTRYEHDGKAFQAAWTAVLPPGLPVGKRWNLVSWDGKQFVRDRVSVDAATGKTVERFPETIHALTRDVAVGASGKLYHPATGKEIGKLSHPADAASAAADGRTVLVNDAENRQQLLYRLEAEK